MLMRRRFLSVAITRRSNANFVRAAGLYERTEAKEYAKRPFLIEDEKTRLSYDQFNKRAGQIASLLSRKYKLKVSICRRFMLIFKLEAWMRVICCDL